MRSKAVNKMGSTRPGRVSGQGDAVLLREAIAKAQEGNREQANNLLRVVCRRSPDNETAWLWRASLAEGPQKAIEYLREVLRINPRHSTALQWLSKFEQELNGGDGYECPFCGRQEPKDFDLCAECGALITLDMEMFQRPFQAKEDLVQKTITYFKANIPHDALNSHYWLAVAYLNLMKSDNALTHLEEAVRIKSGEPVWEEALKELRSRKLVMVVDDSATIRSLVTRTLERSRYRTIEAPSGIEALSRLEGKKIDAVVLDIGMPVMDGYKVCKVLRDHPRTRDVPVIMLSGHDGFFDKVRGKLAGTTDYLTKPLKPAALLGALAKHIPAGSQN